MRQKGLPPIILIVVLVLAGIVGIVYLRTKIQSDLLYIQYIRFKESPVS